MEPEVELATYEVPALETESAVGLAPDVDHNLQGAEPLKTLEPPEAQFLQVYLDDLPLLLPVANLVEIMKLSQGQVVPMFQMVPWVVGVYNWRGDILWIADLGHFLGMAPWYDQAEPSAKHTVVVIQPPPTAAPVPGEKTPVLGLVVSAVEEMVAYPVEAVQPVPDSAEIPLGIAPFLAGCCVAESGYPQLIVEGGTILTAMAQDSG
ncbi:MAG: chemotaxis protein CheW [Nodosilinea sp.]